MGQECSENLSKVFIDDVKSFKDLIFFYAVKRGDTFLELDFLVSDNTLLFLELFVLFLDLLVHIFDVRVHFSPEFIQLCSFLVHHVLEVSL